MDSILYSVLSIFSNNPIFVLAIIAYIAFTIIKSKNTEEAAAAQRDIKALSMKSSSSNPSYTTSKTRLDREAVTGPTLSERLAEFKRDKVAKEGQVLIENVGITTAPTALAATSTRGRKSNHALKEGMKWSIILSKPKALERRYR